MSEKQVEELLLDLDEPLTEEQAQEINSKYKDSRTRGWTFIVWEDSTDIELFKRKIQDQGRLGLKSIFIRHDKDTRADGSPKKVHWHVILLWDNTTTFKNALEVAQTVSNTTYIEPVRSITGAARYLTHMDDADKYQYDKSEVFEVGGADYSELINSSRNDRLEVMAMCEYIRNNGITSFDTFVYYCMDENLEWLRIISERNTFFFKNLIQSQHFRIKEELSDRGPAIKKFGSQYVNILTGEVIWDEADEQKE